MEEVKRGRGRPRKYDENNPKPKMNDRDVFDVIKKPQNTNTPIAWALPEGDNNKYTTFAFALMEMPKIDTYNPDEMRRRIGEYFRLCAEHDMKPGVTALALALGMNRRRLWEINTDQPHQRALPQECKDMIKMAYNSLEVLWESYMQNGKINPVSGIFLGKNHWGYKDQQEYVVTPNMAGEEESFEVIEAKYDELPEE